MKKMTLPIAVAVAIIGCVLAVSANVTTSQLSTKLENERAKRFMAEEALQKTQIEVKKLEGQLQDSQAKLSKIQEVFNQGQSKTTELSTQMKNLMQEREQLKAQVQQLQSQLQQK